MRPNRCTPFEEYTVDLNIIKYKEHLKDVKLFHSIKQWFTVLRSSRNMLSQEKLYTDTANFLNSIINTWSKGLKKSQGKLVQNQIY